MREVAVDEAATPLRARTLHLERLRAGARVGIRVGISMGIRVGIRVGVRVGMKVGMRVVTKGSGLHLREGLGGRRFLDALLLLVTVRVRAGLGLGSGFA